MKSTAISRQPLHGKCIIVNTNVWYPVYEITFVIGTSVMSLKAGVRLPTGVQIVFFVITTKPTLW
jgi:hypothetical protein